MVKIFDALFCVKFENIAICNSSQAEMEAINQDAKLALSIIEPTQRNLSVYGDLIYKNSILLAGERGGRVD